MSPTTTPPCPLCGGSMHWAVPPDGRTTRWWCNTPGCLGRREPESQIAAPRLLDIIAPRPQKEPRT